MNPSDKGESLREIGRVALVGAGKMGGALLEAWLNLGLDARNICVIEPDPSPEIAALAARGLTLGPDPAAARDADVVVLAVKPQIAPAALPGLAAIARGTPLVVSIMAGRTLGFLEDAFRRDRSSRRARARAQS
jgi:pyrroline-5-carboxylate reductase